MNDFNASHSFRDPDEVAMAQLGKMEFPFDGKLECAALSGLNHDVLPKRFRTHIQFQSGKAFHQAASSCDLIVSQVETREFPQKYGMGDWRYLTLKVSSGMHGFVFPKIWLNQKPRRKLSSQTIDHFRCDVALSTDIPRTANKNANFLHLDRGRNIWHAAKPRRDFVFRLSYPFLMMDIQQQNQTGTALHLRRPVMKP